ncbi:MAG: gspC [Polaromonas sp.]|nr:gspC [Polaromonas sp.]
MNEAVRLSGRARSRTAPPPARAARPALWAVLGGLCGTLAAALCFAPARWLAAAVQASSGQRVLLAEAHGSVWQGSARLVLAGGEGSRDLMSLPGILQWSLRPGLGAWHITLLAPCCTPQPVALRISPRPGGWRVEAADAQASWPAALLAGLGAPWNTLRPTGQMSLHSQSLSAVWHAGRLQVAGSAVLEARQIESPLSTLKPLGSYRLLLRGGPSVTVVLDTLEGGLQLSGSGQWTGSRLRFAGEATAAPEREEALANLLNIIGQRDGSRSIITLD